MRSSEYDRRWRPGQAFFSLTCLCVSAYFAYHSYNGRYGFEARSRLIEQQTLLDFEIKSLEAARSRWQRDIALLNANPPHPDIIEDVARDELGFAHPDELVLFHGQSAR
ncbi:MAG: FtsB family cell division protein [Hyphomicrobiaceae bacterium]